MMTLLVLNAWIRLQLGFDATVFGYTHNPPVFNLSAIEPYLGLHEFSHARSVTYAFAADPLFKRRRCFFLQQSPGCH